MPDRRSLSILSALALAWILPAAHAQMQDPATKGDSAAMGPIAIVSLDAKQSGAGPTVTGALQVTAGKAVIAASGQITAGSEPANVLLPRRGSLRVCQSTSVRLTAASNAVKDPAQGLMLAMDYGALEISFASATTSDVLLTPDFRIQPGGAGKADLHARVADHGDTCVDNRAADGPVVLVTSVFDGSTYAVRPGQRVMLHHGSLHEVSDMEKEPCGCPPSAAEVKGNDFPLAQSEGLEPTPAPKASASGSGSAKPVSPPLVFNAGQQAAQTTSDAGSASPSNDQSKTSPATANTRKKNGVFHRMGSFFHHIFHW